jgi:hypothetical protein
LPFDQISQDNPDDENSDEIVNSRVFLPCSHKFRNVNKVFISRIHWFVIQKCRKCYRQEKNTYTVDLNDNSRVRCTTELIKTEVIDDN